MLRCFVSFDLFCFVFQPRRMDFASMEAGHNGIFEKQSVTLVGHALEHTSQSKSNRSVWQEEIGAGYRDGQRKGMDTCTFMDDS